MRTTAHWCQAPASCAAAGLAAAANCVHLGLNILHRQRHAARGSGAGSAGEQGLARAPAHGVLEHPGKRLGPEQPRRLRLARQPVGQVQFQLQRGQAEAEIQRSRNDARAVLERLTEEGLVEARGEGRGRVYHLAARFYNAVGHPEAYVRVHGLDPIRQEAAVLQFVQAHGRIKRENVIELCGLTARQASLLLSRLVQERKLRQQGVKRWTYYEARNL